MRLVETITREVFKGTPQAIGLVLSHLLINTPLDKLLADLFFVLRTFACPLLSQQLTKQVPFIKANVFAQLVSQGSNLLLEDEETVSLLCYILHLLVCIKDIFWILLCFDILLVYIGTQWTRTVDRSNRRDINDILWLCLLAEVLCSTLSKLEDTSPLAFVEDILVDLLVF